MIVQFVLLTLFQLTYPADKVFLLKTQRWKTGKSLCNNDTFIRLQLPFLKKRELEECPINRSTYLHDNIHVL